MTSPSPAVTAGAGRQAPGAPPPSYPDHVCRLLEEAIIEGRLAPGERVMEAQLAETLGVSRTPIREAMRVLQERGLIVHKPNKGTYVASRTTRDEAEVLYRLRIPLESHLAAAAAQRIDAAGLDELRRLHHAFEEALAAGDVDRHLLVGLDSEFHWTIYRAAESDLVSTVGSYWGRMLRELSDRTYRSEPPARFAGQHEQLIEALARGDAEAAAKLMTEHIETSWRAVSSSYDAGPA